MSMLDSIFDKMAGAQGSNSGVFFTEGLYKVTLKEIEFKPQGFKGKSCIFRFNVDETSRPDMHPVGSTRVWIIKLDRADTLERALADIKNMIFALCGIEPSTVKSPETAPQQHAQAADIFKAAIDATFSQQRQIPQNLVIGKQAALECLLVNTKPTPQNPNGGKFTKHVWSVAAPPAAG